VPAGLLDRAAVRGFGDHSIDGSVNEVGTKPAEDR
jgi:hypothetical protein